MCQNVQIAFTILLMLASFTFVGALVAMAFL
jgi:hypothetical protein